jgi:hypothetical protein
VKDAFSLTGATAVALAFFALISTGCGSSSPVSEEAARLSRSQALWRTSGVQHYAFTIQRSCFCPLEYVQPVRIEVENGTVRSIAYEDGKPADPAAFASFDTVEELFGQIEEALKKDATLASVEYDPALGFLKSASIDWIPLAADDETSYTITGFTRL